MSRLNARLAFAALTCLVGLNGDASAADALKIAVGQCGNWDSSPVQLGDGAGIYARYGIAVEAVCTQGTGETQQAVISGSADIGIGIGTLGALGDVKPVMAGWATTNGLETLVYLSSAPLSCAMMMTRGTKWLASMPAGTQVIEIVVRGAAAAQSYPVGMFMGEVNYAEGSKSSSTEVVGKAGSITYTKADAKGVHEGMVSVTAPFTLSGTFHAEWCEGGTEY